MTELLTSVLVVSAVAIVMALLALLAIRVRRRGAAGPAIGAAMAAYDEAMNSTAHDTFVEMQAEDNRAIRVSAPRL